MKANQSDTARREELLAKNFSPSLPINEEALFAGRKKERREILLALNQPGQHVAVFGERGVGKTSLANIIVKECKGSGRFSARINCDTTDDFGTVWHKAFEEIKLNASIPQAGFGATDLEVATSLADDLPEQPKPNDIRKALVELGWNAILVLDEFDRLGNRDSRLFADTIKTLSDQNVTTKIVLVGVADNIDALMKEHASIDRALHQVPMPRMSNDENKQIITSGLSRSEMRIPDSLASQIASLAQGFPHYAHLMGLYAGLAANDGGRVEVLATDLDKAVRSAIDRAQASIKSEYNKATTSPRRDALFKIVLLACALAKTDVGGYFYAADVRDQLTILTHKEYRITDFAQHLNDFSEKRGPILEKVGHKRKFRFRFINPLMQTYVILEGLAAGKLQLHAA